MGRVYMKPKWSKEQTQVLLQELQKYPVLYSQTHPHYQHQLLRRSALEEMVNKLEHVKPGVTAEHVAQKIKGMKSQFNMEKMKMEAMPPKLRSSYTPALWCYDMLTFLDIDEASSTTKQVFLSSRKQNSFKEDDDFIDLQEDPISTVEEIRPVDIPKNTQARGYSEGHSVLVTKCLQLIETLSNEMQYETEEQTGNETIISSPQTFLALLIENELSNISPELYNDAKWKIINVLEEASRKEHDLKAGATLSNSPMTQTLACKPQTIVNLAGRISVTPSNHVFKSPMIPLPHGSRVVIVNTNMANNENL